MSTEPLPEPDVSPGPGFARTNMAGWIVLATTIGIVFFWSDAPNWALLLDAAAIAGVTAASIRFIGTEPLEVLKRGEYALTGQAVERPEEYEVEALLW